MVEKKGKFGCLASNECGAFSLNLPLSHRKKSARFFSIFGVGFVVCIMCDKNMNEH